MPPRPDLPDDQLALPEGALHYTEAGRGPTVLLVHGSLCDYRYWRWQIPAFADSCRVIAVSLRGCWPDGGEHPQPGYAVDPHAHDLMRLLEVLAPDGAHVVGHSRGAQVTLALARIAPQLCRSITLADPGFRFDDEPERPPFYTGAVEAIRAGRAEEGLQAFVDTANGADTWRRMVGWFKEMVRDNARTLLSQIRDANLPVAVADASQLRCPLLLVGGSQSPAKYGTRQDRLQSLLPRSQRVRIALSAHGMNLSNPRAFNRAVLSFVYHCAEAERAD